MEGGAQHMRQRARRLARSAACPAQHSAACATHAAAAWPALASVMAVLAPCSSAVV